MVSYYLSEMSVSDQHGGGITLQQVLGPHLDQIKRFVSFGGFARHKPPAAKLRARSTILTFPLETLGIDRWLPTWCCGLAWRALQKYQLDKLRSDIRSFIDQDPEAYWLLCAQTYYLPLIWNNGGRPLSRRYVAWMMDDHLLRFDGKSLSYPRMLRSVMRRHLTQAAHVFVISPAMQAFYRDQFGVDSTVLFGGVPSELSPPASHNLPNAQNEPTRLAYFGSVSEWQLGPLVYLTQNLAQIGATLDIYSFDPPPAELSGALVNYRGPLDRSAVLARMATYDAIVLPISEDNSLRQMTDLNIATKMSECLASGAVTLVLGPSRAAMVSFLKPYDAAIIVDESSVNDLAAGVRTCRDPIVRRRICANAARLVREQLTNEVMRERFEAALASLNIGPLASLEQSCAI